MAEKRAPLSDPKTGKPLPQTAQPGYYPGFSTLSQQAWWDEATRKLVLRRVDENSPIRFFTAEEAGTMEAVLDRILPQEDRIQNRRIALLPALDERLYENRIEGYRYEDMPSDQEAYKLAARAFEAMAQELRTRSFRELELLDKEKILLSLHDAEPLAAKALWAQLNVERFWTLLVSDCCSAYYAHPWAWDEVGYGGPAYPRAYMRLTDGDAEPWEVNERRYEWQAPADTLSDRGEAHGKGKEHQTHHGQAGTH